jgi:hypothetical protein
VEAAVHNVQISRMQLDEVRDSLENWTSGLYGEVDIHHAYIGRGMYGGSGCIAVSATDTVVPTAFLFLVAEVLGLDFLRFLEQVGGGETDSWGMSTIFYWRGLALMDPA